MVAAQRRRRVPDVYAHSRADFRRLPVQKSGCTRARAFCCLIFLQDASGGPLPGWTNHLRAPCRTWLYCDLYMPTNIINANRKPSAGRLHPALSLPLSICPFPCNVPSYSNITIHLLFRLDVPRACRSNTPHIYNNCKWSKSISRDSLTDLRG